jgi:hypothetical protein
VTGKRAGGVVVLVLRLWPYENLYRRMKKMKNQKKISHAKNNITYYAN